MLLIDPPGYIDALHDFFSYNRNYIYLMFYQIMKRGFTNLNPSIN